jgi:hypothetical protein
MTFDINTIINNPEQMEAHIRAELEKDLENGYTARFYLFDKFNELKMMGHETPFERIGEILNEFEHALEYTESHVGRFFYQDLIDNVIWYCERDRRAPPGIFTYPNIL